MSILSIIKKLLGREAKPVTQRLLAGATLPATIIPRTSHAVSRSDISENAIKVMKRLNTAGYQAYLVGGSVRDLLLRHAPKDFDIATDAEPEDVRKLFRNCRLIGRRFRLAHVHFGREVIEVATFRGGSDMTDHADRRLEDGMIVRDNVFGAIDEDALRRDFTVNALYYSVADFAIVDFVTGYSDVQNKILRLIGDPAVRYQEDPVRILRAIRFAAKLNFSIAPETAAPIAIYKEHLSLVSSARLFEEIQKLFLTGHALATYHLLQKYELFSCLFPAAAPHTDHDQNKILIEQTLINTDVRVREEKPVTPAFLLAALLWQPMQEISKRLRKEGIPPLPALEEAMTQVIVEQVKIIGVPKRFTRIMREIWILQYRLQRRYGRRPMRLLEHPRFRAGYDFLAIRVASGEEEQELLDWWTAFQTADDAQQEALLATVKRNKPRQSRR